MDWVVEDRAGRAPNGLTLDEAGLAFADDGRLVRVRWDQVFGAERVTTGASERLFVMVPRQPPSPPWIEITLGHLPASLRAGGLAGLERMVEERISRRGFREGPRREAMDLDTLTARVMARDDVPGAVEVPVTIAGSSGGSVTPWWTVVAAPVGAVLTFAAFAMYFMGILMAIQSPAARVILVAIGALVVGVATFGFALYARHYTARRARARELAGVPRVLVMCPDGFVIGTKRGVRSFRWSDVGGLVERLGVLAVLAPNGATIAEVEAKWFAEPLWLITKVATAYRERVAR